MDTRNLFVVSKFATSNSLKPVYVNMFTKTIKYTMLGTNEVIKIANIDSLHLYSKIMEIFKGYRLGLDVYSKLTDEKLLNKYYIYLGDIVKKSKNKNDDLNFIDILEYLYVRWLNEIKIKKDEFDYISKIFLQQVFYKNYNPELVNYFKELKNTEKCRLIHILYTGILFNRMLVIDIL